MNTWTAEARSIIDTYLSQVSRLAAERGEDSEELRASLVEHIENEAASREWLPITADQARQLIAKLGAPGFFEDYFDGKHDAIRALWQVVNQRLSVAG